MHAGIKLLIGIILILLGFWLLVPADSAVLSVIKPASISNIGGISLDWWSEFKTVLKGVIPPIVIILGILIVWIESEELKSPVIPEKKKEIKKEPEKAEEKKEEMPVEKDAQKEETEEKKIE